MSYTEETRREREKRKALQAEHLRTFLDEQLDGDVWLLHVITTCGMKTVEGWLNGERVMDGLASCCINSAFPEYSVQWLEGRSEQNEEDSFGLRRLMQPIDDYERHYAALRDYCKARVEWLKTRDKDAGSASSAR